MQGGNRIQDEVETAGVLVHLVGVAREDDLMRAKAECVVFLGGRSRENHDVRAKGPGEFNTHVPKTTETDNANFLARANFPMAQRRIGGDAGAEQRGDSGQRKIFRRTEDKVLIHDDAFRIAAVSRKIEVFVGPAIRPDLARTELLVARAAMGTRQIGINEAADTGQVARFEFGDGGTDLGYASDDLVAGNARINGLHEAAPLVARVVEVRMANAAEQNLDLHVVFRWIASWDAGVGQRRSRAGGRISFAFIHMIISCLFSKIGYVQRPVTASFGRCRVRHSPGEVPSQSLKGTKEGVGVLVSEQESRFVQLNGAVFEVLVRQLAPGFLHQLLEGHFGISKAALQGAGARAEFPRDLRQRGAFSRERALEGMFDLVAHIRAGVFFLEFGLQLSADRLEQLLVLGDKRPVEVAVPKHECVARGFEPHPAAEMGFQQLGVLRGTGQFEAQRGDLPVCAAATNSQNP